MANALLPAAVGLPVLVALVLGPGPFAIALVLVAAVVVLDTSGLLADAAARPILPAALIPGVGLPTAVALRPDTGWDLVPVFAAAGFLATFLFALLFGRRRDVVQGAGTTVLVGLLVGLGTASLLLLRGLPDGFRWVLAFSAVAVAADVAGPLWERLRRRRVTGDRPRAESDAELGAATVGALLAGTGAAGLLRPPLGLAVGALLTLVALTAAVGATDLLRALQADADPVAPRPPRLGGGALLGVVDGILIGAPAVYVLARSAVL